MLPFNPFKLSHYVPHAHCFNMLESPKLDRPAVPGSGLLSDNWTIAVWGRGSAYGQFLSRVPSLTVLLRAVTTNESKLWCV